MAEVNDFENIPGVIKNLEEEIVLNESVAESSYSSISVPDRIELEPATALEFRNNLNQNFINIGESFGKIDKEIENVYDNMVGLIMSSEQPLDGIQKTGDFWFKIIE